MLRYSPVHGGCGRGGRWKGVEAVRQAARLAVHQSLVVHGGLHVLHLMIVDYFQVGDDADHHTTSQSAPNSKLSRSQFHVEATGVDDVALGDVLAGSEATGRKSLRHFGAETHESQGDEEGGNYRHQEHDGAETHVQEEAQEGGLLLLVGQPGEAVDLDETDEENKDRSDNWVIAENRLGRHDVEGAILL